MKSERKTFFIFKNFQNSLTYTKTKIINPQFTKPERLLDFKKK